MSACPCTAEVLRKERDADRAALDRFNGMKVKSPDGFDVTALYAALDAQRVARGMSWLQVAREISGRIEGVPARSIGTSTLTGMRARGAVEGDGVLQMLLWLGRPPESFMPGHEEGKTATASLPRIAPGQVLRFDAKAMHASLNARRIERGMTWQQVASEIGSCNASSLTRLAKGGRVSFPQVMRIFAWLGRPAARFTRISAW